MSESSAVASVLVPSALYNMQLILEDMTGPHGAALLGTAWHFAALDATLPLGECDLPVTWERYATLLQTLAGVKLEHHPADEANHAYDRVEFGQPIVLAVDSYHLPYRPAFRRVNSARTIIVTAIDMAAGMVEIVDPWMPNYRGAVALADLDRARASVVPSDHGREPLYAGDPLRRRWWTLALLGDPLLAHRDSTLRALALLTAQAEGHLAQAATPDALEQSRIDIVGALAMPLADSQSARRRAALHLRGEIGLRAYLVEFFRVAADVLDDPLLGGEIAAWSMQLAELARARDVLIKSIVFDRPIYGEIVDDVLVMAIRRERRFLQFMKEAYSGDPAEMPQAGSVSC